MNPRVYLETTVLSYLAAEPSRDIVIAGQQQVTRDLWGRRGEYDFFLSQIVLDEIARGDPEQARRRLELAKELPILDVTDDVSILAEELVTHGPIPESCADDALHIAAATIHGMDFLATWNCRHIANARHQRDFRKAMDRLGYVCVQICTPEELPGEDSP